MAWNRLLEFLGLRPRSAEPAPVRDADGGELRWVDPATLQMGPVRHQLDEAQHARIVRLHDRLVALDGWTVEKRADLFARDLDPDREIAICERIADRCERAFQDLAPLTHDQQREIYGLLMGMSGVPADEVLEHYTPRTITRDQARHALAADVPKAR